MALPSLRWWGGHLLSPLDGEVMDQMQETLAVARQVGELHSVLHCREGRKRSIPPNELVVTELEGPTV